MNPAGPRTKNDCAGEGQQQFAQLTDWKLKASERDLMRAEQSSMEVLRRIPVIGGHYQAMGM
jgi:hypothetical protein